MTWKQQDDKIIIKINSFFGTLNALRMISIAVKNIDMILEIFYWASEPKRDLNKP